ncbi:MAG: hypothetical protein JXA07_00110 [Spirochaetes bacterium]|nr:hypothetical protein [Spirochaetota bacterium]
MRSRIQTVQALVVVLFASVILLSQPEFITWQKIFGTEDRAGGKTEDIPAKIFLLKDGGYLITGDARCSNGAGDPCGMSVIKLDKNGSVSWMRFPAGDRNIYTAYPGVFVDLSEGGFVFGGKKYFSLGLTRIDDSAKIIWDRKYDLNNANDMLTVAEMADKNIAAILLGRGDSKALMLVVDKNGNVVSVKKIPAELDGFSAGGVSKTRDDGFILAGVKYVAVYGQGGLTNQDVRVLKLNGQGGVAWDRTFGGAGQDFGRSASQTTDGGFIVAASSSITPAKKELEFLVIRLDANGNRLWEKNYGSPDSCRIRSCYETSDGGIICAGTRMGSAGNHYMLVKLDARGNKVWEKFYGGGRFNILLNCFAIAPDGGFIMAGKLEDWPASMTDYYVVKTDDKGNIAPQPSEIKSLQ